jgi:addiction module HigA family antidote
MRKKLLPTIHPEEILREEFIKPLNLSANALAQRLGVTTARVKEIANERRDITADTALRLARCFPPRRNSG